MDGDSNDDRGLDILSKFTPGPWEVEFDEGEEGHVIRMGKAIYNRGNYATHEVVIYGHGVYPEDGDQFKSAEANANLIAAAPDMYELLDLIRYGLITGRPLGDGIINQIINVIREAEGGTK